MPCLLLACVLCSCNIYVSDLSNLVIDSSSCFFQAWSIGVTCFFQACSIGVTCLLLCCYFDTRVSRVKKSVSSLSHVLVV